MRWICGKSPQLIDVGRLKHQSGLQPGVRTDSFVLILEKAMKRIGFASQVMDRFGVPSSQDDRRSAGFEELAMPLFDSLYNFARWLVQNSNDAEDLVQESYLKALRSFASFQPGTNFRAWMFQILRNTFLSSRSRLNRRMTVAIDSEDDTPLLPATSATPESLLIERFQEDAVQ